MLASIESIWNFPKYLSNLYINLLEFSIGFVRIWISEIFYKLLSLTQMYNGYRIIA